MSEIELKSALENFRQRGVDTFPAKVLSVDKEAGTCVVNRGNMTFKGVKLSSTVGGNRRRFYLYPKIGSYVLVSTIQEDIKNLYIELYSEIEELSFLTGTTNFGVSSDGITLERNELNLKNVLGDFIDVVSQIVVLQGSGPNVAALIEIKNRLNQILK